ncbi:uncharacterized protein LOC110985699 [Acanthaster planci]|uniref:Uncharacterized protein LOC110985699 n=1 Tax=Acanthaster planci TaxID=133434 RepID=A0A8B7ZAC2_ACAPL|nr:uncharacterized protein LOC110985699 [Acanthaster planci]
MSTLIYLGVLLLAGCFLIPTGQAGLNPDLRDIPRLNWQYKTALESNDIDSILELYADNALILPNGHPGFVGKNKLASSLRSLPSVGTMEFNIRYLDFINWNNGLVLELISHTAWDDQGNVIFKGKTLLLWKWTGTWKIVLRMINSDQ